VKAELDKLGTAWNEFKKSNEERWKQIDSKGSADPLLEQEGRQAERRDLQDRSERQPTADRHDARSRIRDRPEAKEAREAIRAFLRGDDHPVRAKVSSAAS
jgi:hypothetical protein